MEVGIANNDCERHGSENKWLLSCDDRRQITENDPHSFYDQPPHKSPAFLNQNISLCHKETGEKSSAIAMSLQYDHIQDDYDEANESVTGQLRQDQVKQVVQPLIQNKRVLDLACGSGFFSYSLIEWGADSVLAVDISPVMIQAAERRGRGRKGCESKVSFLVADCMQEIKYDGAPFDVIFSAWLLDNAPDKQSLCKLFRTIRLNLKQGGYYVSVTLPPADDPASMLDHRNRARLDRPSCEGFYADSYEKIADGLLVHFASATKSGQRVELDSYYLTRETHERAAEAAGMTGDLQWIPQTVTMDSVRRAGVIDEKLASELMTYNDAPEYAILKIRLEAAAIN